MCFYKGYYVFSPLKMFASVSFLCEQLITPSAWRTSFVLFFCLFGCFYADVYLSLLFMSRVITTAFYMTWRLKKIRLSKTLLEDVRFWHTAALSELPVFECRNSPCDPNKERILEIVPDNSSHMSRDHRCNETFAIVSMQTTQWFCVIT